MSEYKFLDWYFDNEQEYKALMTAQEGNPTLLSEFITEYGHLRTNEARQFVSDTLMGKPKKRGSKRTIAQQAKELGVHGLILDIMKEHSVKKNRAIDIYAEKYEPNTPRETIRDHEKKGEAILLSLKNKDTKKVGGGKPYFTPKT